MGKFQLFSIKIIVKRNHYFENPKTLNVILLLALYGLNHGKRMFKLKLCVVTIHIIKEQKSIDLHAFFIIIS